MDPSAKTKREVLEILSKLIEQHQHRSAMCFITAGIRLELKGSAKFAQIGENSTERIHRTRYPNVGGLLYDGTNFLNTGPKVCIDRVFHLCNLYPRVKCESVNS